MMNNAPPFRLIEEEIDNLNTGPSDIAFYYQSHESANPKHK
jgi:hypothetical protein